MRLLDNYVVIELIFLLFCTDKKNIINFKRYETKTFFVIRGAVDDSKVRGLAQKGQVSGAVSVRARKS